MPLDMDDVLEDIHETAFDKPYETFLQIDTKYHYLPEIEKLAAREFCIWVICADLNEHGTENISLTDVGGLTADEIYKIHSDLTAKLLTSLKENSGIDVHFWRICGKIPMRIESLLKATDI